MPFGSLVTTVTCPTCPRIIQNVTATNYYKSLHLVNDFFYRAKFKMIASGYFH